MKFALNEKQVAKYRAWRQEKDAAVLAAQKIEGKRGIPLIDGDEAPYYGAIGGAYTFKFTPTSIGDIVVVKHADGEELDLSDEGGFG